jgi:hypothetical protein
VIRSLLEGEGIEALIPDEYFLGTYGPHSGIAIGGVRVMVRSNDLERARTILAATEPIEKDSETFSADEDG